MEDMKQCTKCKEYKPYKNFDRDRMSEDGFSSICKDCKRKYMVEYLKKRKKELLEKYDEETVSKILAQKLWVGMTTGMVRDCWGKPEKVDTSVKSQGVHEIWIYLNQRARLVFDDGKLSSWENL